MPDAVAMYTTGQGFDVHAFAAGCPLILGGIEIPHERGLAGHSDADVLAHAISDAVLGACCEGDIGRHFPDTDPAHKGADSIRLLERCVELASQRGGQVVHVDATIIAQRPKMAPHIPAMLDRLGAVLPGAALNVKATTTERLGFTGREEGIAALATATLLFPQGLLSPGSE